MKKPKLNISEKNFIYNIILTILICLIIFFYMIFFMPKIYLEKKMEENEGLSLKIHNAYTKDLSYENVRDMAKEGMISLKASKNDDEVSLSGLNFDTKLRIKNKNIIDLLTYLENAEDNFDDDIFRRKITLIKDDLLDRLDSLFEFYDYSSIDIESDNSVIVKRVNKNILIKAKSTSIQRSAISFMVISYDNDNIFISVYPFLFDDITGIKSTIISAFPVIFLLIIIIVFLLNKLYSKQITDPILAMSKFTRQYNFNQDISYNLDIDTKDEIEELSKNIKQTYEKLNKSYKKLEKSSKKREIFIKSTSHELKTPIQAAILLADGMIENIGKYKDRDTYLPILKDKLTRLQILIGDLLYLNRLDEDPSLEELDLGDIALESINNHSDLIGEKRLGIDIKGSRMGLYDYDHFRIIFDNIIKNAIEYTDKDGQIRIVLGEYILVENYPTKLSDSILADIKKPFVSSNSSKSRGLGMYIIESLLDESGYHMDISYKDDKFSILIKEDK